MKRLSTKLIFALGTLAAVGVARAESLEGRWSATIVQRGLTIPFRLDIAGDADRAVGTLYNGEDKETTTSARIRDGKVELNFEHYLVSIVATAKDGELDGKLENRRSVARQSAQLAGTPARGEGDSSVTSYPFHATRYASKTHAAVGQIPSIDGVWELPHDSPKGEKAWRLIVKQSGADITATVLRVDGDTGALTGGWQDGKFVASHFDGARPGVITITPETDGTLRVELNAAASVNTFTAYRPDIARVRGLPEPANYRTHTTVRNPDEVFTYSFPDTTGKIVSNEDPKFKGKVVLAVVTGTWCPNCHDEAQYLVELYARYHGQGLEIVALDFEEPEQQNSLTRVNAFLKKYRVPYIYLIAGAPAEMSDKVSQAVNLNTWPATLFIGRDGKVKATHAGFAGPASGEFHAQLRQEFTSTIERLLKEKATLRSSAE